MGVSTNGQICFGVLLDEDVELPWNENPYDGDIEEWWITSVKKWNPPFKLYNEDGEFLPGMEKKDKIRIYYKDRREFIDDNPVPIKCINVCSVDFPIYILAVQSTVKYANRGYPTSFNPHELKITNEDSEMLLDFVNDFNIECNDEPKWYLSSYWG